jgi:hypothetical protein
VCIAAGFVVAGCTGGHHSTASKPPTTTAIVRPTTATGVVKGSLSLVAMVEQPLPGRVHADSPSGHYSADVPASGKFTMRLPSGTYVFTATSPKYQGGAAVCRVPHPVRVVSPSQAATAINCQGI